MFSEIRKQPQPHPPRPEETTQSGWNVSQIIDRALPLELAHIGDQRIDVCFG